MKEFYLDNRTGNNSKDLKAIENHFKANRNDTYYDKSIKEFRKIIKGNAQAQLYKYLPETEGETKKEVKAEVKAAHVKNVGDEEKDRLFNEVVRQERAVVKGFARGNKFERTMEDLKSVSVEELEKELGKDLVAKMNKSFLSQNVKDDGTFDVSNLSKTVFKTVGYDYMMNRSEDTHTSEFFHTKKALEDLLGTELTDKEVNKLRKYVAIPMEPKERKILQWGNIISSMIAGGTAGPTGAVISHLLTRPILVTQESTQDVTITALTKDLIEGVANQLKEEGVAFTQSGASINIHQYAFQQVETVHKLVGVLESAAAGLGIGILAALIMDSIFGEGQKYEKSCISLTDIDSSDPAFSNFEEFKKWAQKKYPERASGLMALASLYSDENGKLDGEGLYTFLRQAAGKGSHINCLEGIMAMLKNPPKVKKPEQKPVVHEAEVTKYTPKEEIQKEIIIPNTIVHDRAYGETWGAIIKAYYTELGIGDIKSDPKLYGKNGLIRQFKRALATDETGVFDPKVFHRLLVDKNLPEHIKIPSEFAGAKRKVNDTERVEFAKAAAGYKGDALKMVGHDETIVDVSTVTVNGQTVYTAKDKEDRSIDAQGTTREEAIEKLQAKTGKTYTKIDDV